MEMTGYAVWKTGDYNIVVSSPKTAKPSDVNPDLQANEGSSERDSLLP